MGGPGKDPAFPIHLAASSRLPQYFENYCSEAGLGKTAGKLEGAKSTAVLCRSRKGTLLPNSTKAGSKTQCEHNLGVGVEEAGSAVIFFFLPFLVAPTKQPKRHFS